MPWQAVLVAIGVLFVIFVGFGFYASRYKKVGPNQVLVISGRRREMVNPVTGQRERVGFRVVKGGGTFIIPVLERVDILSMEILTIEVEVRSVYTVEGVPVHVDGVAQIKIRGEDISIWTAAEQFLSKGPDGIIYVAHETLAGHLRAILGMLTVEEIYKDRDAFAQKVLEVSGGDLANMGLEIVSFVIKDIRDDKEYLESLGRTRTAEVKRDAVKGEAEAQRDATIAQAHAARDATIQSAEARQLGETAKFQAETKIAEAQKNYRVEKAHYDEESNRSEVQAELARTLQEKITNQEITAQEVQIEVVAKQKQIEVQEQEVQRRARELEATVEKPAEAERYRIETLANAKKFQTETEAAGTASATRLQGEGDADATKARGLAQADVIKAQGFSEAEAMEKKAEAWQKYNQAAIIQQLIEALPQVAAAVAQPLAQTDRIVVISSGGDGAGASKVTADVTNIIAQVPATLEALTGVNLIDALGSLPGIGQPAEDEPADE
ncbi:MAG: SPFH domain-containing protein [Anaerolineae bacterium]|jgi:flotillin